MHLNTFSGVFAFEFKLIVDSNNVFAFAFKYIAKVFENANAFQILWIKLFYGHRPEIQ